MESAAFPLYVREACHRVNLSTHFLFEQIHPVLGYVSHGLLVRPGLGELGLRLVRGWRLEAGIGQIQNAADYETFFREKAIIICGNP